MTEETRPLAGLPRRPTIQVAWQCALTSIRMWAAEVAATVTMRTVRVSLQVVLIASRRTVGSAAGGARDSALYPLFQRAQG